jgi:ABC-type multidrug transport system fused ATPase/permease subunit
MQLASSTLEIGGTKCPSYLPVSGLIEVRDLNFGYVPGYRIFDGLSFHVNKGEVVGIVGKSGRGKSTLFKLLLKLYSVRPGAIFVGGTDINLVSTLWWRSQIAIIPQDADLFEGTIYANLTYGLENGKVSSDEIDAVLEDVNLLDFVNALPDGLQTRVSVYPSCSLSGGQAQRLCIARSLLRKPQIMLFDECTSKLDPANKELIIELMRSRRDMTMLVIAHDSDVMLVVDRKVYI